MRAQKQSSTTCNLDDFHSMTQRICMASSDVRINGVGCEAPKFHGTIHVFCSVMLFIYVDGFGATFQFKVVIQSSGILITYNCAAADSVLTV